MPIKKSVTDDYITSLEDGAKLKMLKRYLMTYFGIRCRGFKSQRSAQRFLTTYAAIYNHFDIQRHINRRLYMKRLRDETAREWKFCAA